MQLGFENKVALDLMQALLGVISSNVRGVSFEYDLAKVTVHYLLAEESVDDREEAEDLVSEFEALQSSPFDITVNVIISGDVLPNGVGSLKGRPVYARKEN